MFQSTRPRGARLAQPSAVVPPVSVSIHAPTRGATSEVIRHFSGLSGFNPRAHAGRDSVFNTASIFTMRFNPRAHAGRDFDFPVVGLTKAHVSIHAPTRGATTNWSGKRYPTTFQSTRPRGARLFDNVQYCNVLGGFNPRAHAGRDRPPRGSCPFLECFNPRAHAGRDDQRGRGQLRRQVSIHAPTRGATPSDSMPSAKRAVSIHAPTRGATLILTAPTSTHLLFQSTRPRGARPGWSPCPQTP